MDDVDADMMEAESTVSVDPPVPPLPPSPSPSLLHSSSDQDGAIRGMLTVARQLIDQGRPSQALQAVISFLPTYSVVLL